LKWARSWWTCPAGEYGSARTRSSGGGERIAGARGVNRALRRPDWDDATTGCEFAFAARRPCHPVAENPGQGKHRNRSSTSGVWVAGIGRTFTSAVEARSPRLLVVGRPWRLGQADGLTKPKRPWINKRQARRSMRRTQSGRSAADMLANGQAGDGLHGLVPRHSSITQLLSELTQAHRRGPGLAIIWDKGEGPRPSGDAALWGEPNPLGRPRWKVCGMARMDLQATDARPR